MTPLGPFAVWAQPEEVSAFRVATGLPPGDAVPVTFPMRWLALPDVRQALLAMATEPGLVPVHEAQTFNYLVPLSIEERYEMNFEACRETEPDRLVLTGTIAGEDGAVHVRSETILRLFSTAVAA